MQVCICDDDLPVAQDLKEIIENIALKEKMEITVNIAETSDELLNCATELDAVFLDIEMPDRNGFETGQAVKEKNPEIIIIMATCHSEMIRKSIHIGVKDFITKPYNIEDVELSLNIIRKNIVGKKELSVYKDRNKYIIRERDICKITSYNGDICIHTYNNFFRKESSIKKILGELGEGMFFQIDRKTIVGFAAVKKYEKGVIFMENEEIRVARDRKKAFERAYIEYDLNYRR